MQGAIRIAKAVAAYKNFTGLDDASNGSESKSFREDHHQTLTKNSLAKLASLNLTRRSSSNRVGRRSQEIELVEKVRQSYDAGHISGPWRNSFSRIWHLELGLIAAIC